MSKPHDTILWRRLDVPGHEAARAKSADGLWRVSGSAVFIEGELPVRLDYDISCDASWNTRSASVTGWVGERTIHLQLEVDDQRQWLMNGDAQSAVSGCIDVDLNFSPSTNLLPLRRLNLAIGEEAFVRAAWLRFPTFRLEVLEQLYRRTSADLYEYESAGGSFKAQLRVNEFGFPVEYAGVWQVEASA